MTTDQIIQIAMAFGGTLGFCLLFNLPKRRIFLASLGGAVCWFIYLAGIRFGFDIFLASFFSSMFAGAYGEILARICKAPTTVFFIPAVVPLIPGSSLYNTMISVLRQEAALSRQYGIETLKFTLGISLGLSLMLAIDHFHHNISVRRKLRREKREAKKNA